MWIKKTAVKTKSGNYTYIQLVQSERVEGKTRHKVIANLGRLDKLDLEQVNAFVHAVTSGTGDSFKLEQIRLLPSKNYGASLILGHMLESLGIQRFLTDLAIYKKMDPDVVNGIFALLVYYSVSEDSSLAFSDFLNRSFLPFSDSIDQKLLVSSLHLLADSSIIRASLLNCAQPDFPLYHYVYYSVNDNLKKISESGVILIVLDSGYVPVDFQSLKYHYPNYSLRSPDDVFVSDNLSLLKKCESFCLESGRYICKLHRKDVTELFKDSGSILSYAASRGQFREYKGLGYRSKNFEGKTVVILRPAPGIAGRITAGQPEPREILVSSLILPPEEILERYFYLEKIQSYYFNIFLPRDLDFLYKKLPARKVLYAIQNLIFIKILLLDSIEKQVRELNLTASDVIQDCDTILCAQLFDGHLTRLLHSEFTPLQMDIFSCLGLQKHPILNFTPSPRNT